ncbi:GNAT family N-acetyltransferase [Kitasatospora sp. NPDC101447]|uniref:GNAT family N-acetyltransferase n=1 Tax=Kitasatospora sp. NPDC101447 TaxID=3364102 RepID=UPI003818B06D
MLFLADAALHRARAAKVSPAPRPCSSSPTPKHWPSPASPSQPAGGSTTRTPCWPRTKAKSSRSAPRAVARTEAPRPALPSGIWRLTSICELAVRPGWQGQGVGTRLHTALLEALRTEWVSLLAMPGNGPSRRLYDRLGYRHAGPYRPGPAGPVLDLLLLRTSA